MTSSLFINLVVFLVILVDCQIYLNRDHLLKLYEKLFTVCIDLMPDITDRFFPRVFFLLNRLFFFYLARNYDSMKKIFSKFISFLIKFGE